MDKHFGFTQWPLPRVVEPQGEEPRVPHHSPCDTQGRIWWTPESHTTEAGTRTAHTKTAPSRAAL